jgi:hypothetical protein
MILADIVIKAIKGAYVFTLKRLRTRQLKKTMPDTPLFSRDCCWWTTQFSQPEEENSIQAKLTYD